jgi:hypothetical protein
MGANMDKPGSNPKSLRSREAGQLAWDALADAQGPTDEQIERGLDAYWQGMGGIEPDPADAVVAAIRAAYGVTLPDGGQHE